MKKSLFTECLRIARAKLIKHPEFNNFPHYSFLIQNNKIVEWATNVKAIPPIHFGYHVKEDFIPKLHAETFCYFKARGLIGNKSFSIINIRLNRKSEIKLSKPCKACHNLMTVLGCKKIYYSSPIGFLSI